MVLDMSVNIQRTSIDTDSEVDFNLIYLLKYCHGFTISETDHHVVRRHHEFVSSVSLSLIYRCEKLMMR